MSTRSLPFSPKSFILGCAAVAAVTGQATTAQAQTLYTTQYGPSGPGNITLGFNGTDGPVGPLAISQFNEAPGGPFYGNNPGPNGANIPFPELVGATFTLVSGVSFSATESMSGNFLDGVTLSTSFQASVSLTDPYFSTVSLTFGPQSEQNSGGESGGFLGIGEHGSATDTYSAAQQSITTTVPVANLGNFVGNAAQLAGDFNFADSSSWSATCNYTAIVGSCSLSGPAWATEFTNASPYAEVTYTYKFVPGPSAAVIYLPGMVTGLAALWRRNRMRRRGK